VFFEVWNFLVLSARTWVRKSICWQLCRCKLNTTLRSDVTVESGVCVRCSAVCWKLPPLRMLIQEVKLLFQHETVITVLRLHYLFLSPLSLPIRNVHMTQSYPSQGKGKVFANKSWRLRGVMEGGASNRHNWDRRFVTFMCQSHFTSSKFLRTHFY
jgi:hypothetical protein